MSKLSLQACQPWTQTSTTLRPAEKVHFINNYLSSVKEFFYDYTHSLQIQFTLRQYSHIILSF